MYVERMIYKWETYRNHHGIEMTSPTYVRRIYIQAPTASSETNGLNILPKDLTTPNGPSKNNQSCETFLTK